MRTGILLRSIMSSIEAVTLSPLYILMMLLLWLVTHECGQGAENVGQGDGKRVENINDKWRGYDIQAIIDQRYGDKLPCAEDSNRHTESLKLATDLLLMLDGDKQRVQRIVEAQPWVQEIIAERNENVAQTVESAASCVKEKEKKYASTLPIRPCKSGPRSHGARLSRGDLP